MISAAALFVFAAVVSVAFVMAAVMTAFMVMAAHGIGVVIQISLQQSGYRLVRIA